MPTNPCQDVLQTLAGLHERADRAAAANALALRMGATQLLVFVKDEKTNAFLPAPGFAPTIAGGPQWKQFFARCEIESQFDCRLPYVRDTDPEPVTAVVDGGCIFVFFGCPQEQELAPLRILMPLLGALFRHEQTELEAFAQARLAMDSAAKSGEMAEALNIARTALQLALQDADVISRAHANQAAELRQSEAQMRTLMKKLEQSNHELEQFAYVAAHDLQEPLRTISSFSSLLESRNGGQLDESGKLFLGFILKGATRARQLIQDLLDFSRIGNSEVRLDQVVELQDSINDAEAALAGAIRDSQATIVSTDLPSVHGDPAQLTQLFQNLLGNAIKFRTDTPPRIEISAKEQAHAWKISVSDNGIGIRPEYHTRVFTIFQRLHTQDQYTGTGIGLAICKRIIERHNGEIGIESRPGEGSTFFFTLPKPVSPSEFELRQ